MAITNVYYRDIIHHLKKGILKEDALTIQKKLIELSKMSDVNAIKAMFLLIHLQEIQVDTSLYIPLNLDYQSEEDKGTILIHLANNQVKLAYRLLEWILYSFYVDTTIKDERNSTVYGYLLAHLADIYRADNNFHSRHELEKLVVKLVKRICMMYPFSVEEICYTDRYGEEQNFLDLYHKYLKKNSYYLNSASPDGQTLTMKKTLNMMKKQGIYIPPKEEITRIRNEEIFQYDERFSDQKRYAEDTYQFCKKYL